MNPHTDYRPDPRRPGLHLSREDLANRIHVYIERKACGRIRDLHVICSDDLIILQGWSKTYHAKQLALEAALDITDGHPLLANQIVVN